MAAVSNKEEDEQFFDTREEISYVSDCDLDCSEGCSSNCAKYGGCSSNVEMTNIVRFIHNLKSRLDILKVLTRDGVSFLSR